MRFARQQLPAYWNWRLVGARDWLSGAGRLRAQRASRDLGGGWSGGRVLGKHLKENVLEPSPEFRPDQTRTGRSYIDVLVEDRRRVVCLEWRFAGDQLVQDTTQRVHVRCLAD